MKFKPEDFGSLIGPCKDPNNLRPEEVVDRFIEVANAKLEEWLKDALVVQGNSGQYPDGDIYFDIPIGGPPYTHKAKLVQIEEVK